MGVEIPKVKPPAGGGADPEAVDRACATPVPLSPPDVDTSAGAGAGVEVVPDILAEVALEVPVVKKLKLPTLTDAAGFVDAIELFCVTSKLTPRVLGVTADGAGAGAPGVVVDTSKLNALPAALEVDEFLRVDAAAGAFADTLKLIERADASSAFVAAVFAAGTGDDTEDEDGTGAGALMPKVKPVPEPATEGAPPRLKPPGAGAGTGADVPNVIPTDAGVDVWVVFGAWVEVAESPKFDVAALSRVPALGAAGIENENVGSAGVAGIAAATEQAVP